MNRTYLRSFWLNSVLSLALVTGCLSIYAQPPSASFAEIAKRVEPAVVSIETKGKIPETAASAKIEPSESDDILEFLRRQNSRRPVFGVGSGFIIDKTGYIITNAHVVDNVSRITVKLDTGDEYPAKVIGTDIETDIAVLKIETGRELPFLRFGDANKAQVGDWVLAIGSPFGLTRSVTAGIISQKKRDTPGNSAFQRFIQTDAAINRGNSGGPLVNLDGDVIGVNSQIATSTGDYNGVGFALPADETSYVFQQILTNGKVRRGYLGILLDSVKSEYAKVYGLKDARGAIITDVRDMQSPAALAGLQVGDIIVEIAGKPVENAQDLIAKVASTSPDESVEFVLFRESGSEIVRKALNIKLGERPTASRIGTDEGDPKKLPLGNENAVQKPFGLTVVDLTPMLATTYKLEGEKGILVKDINPASYIADVRATTGEPALAEGDVIQRINRVTVTEQKAFAAEVAKLRLGDAVVLHVLTYDARTRSPQLKIIQFTVR